MAKTRRSQNGNSLHGFCQSIGVSLLDWYEALDQRKHIYIEHLSNDRKRWLQYPPDDSTLYSVQKAISQSLLSNIPLVDEIRGYRKGEHNIKVSAEIAGAPFQGTLDISKFHPSIRTRHVIDAMRKHGCSGITARRAAQVVMYRGRLPQGAPSSNHVANIVIDVVMRRRILPHARSMGVGVRNYGDDIAFFGANADRVRNCVRKSQRALEHYGFNANDKGSECEHRGGRRRFIGCATGRKKPDYPRDKYRKFRRELRAILWCLRCGDPAATRITKKDLNSIRHRIAYIKRLNPRKARTLLDLFYRVCAARRDQQRSIAA